MQINNRSSNRANPYEGTAQRRPAEVAKSYLVPDSEKPFVKKVSSYAIVISAFENATDRSKLAEPLGIAIQQRLDVMSDEHLRQLQALPEFIKIGGDIESLGQQMVDTFVSQDGEFIDEKEVKEALNLLKNPLFAKFMEPQASSQRSFAGLLKKYTDDDMLFAVMKTFAVDNGTKFSGLRTDVIV